MKSNPIKSLVAPSIPVSIFIAGDLSTARDACRLFCFNEGLCVTVTATDYVFTGGMEAGVIVGLINYPRFPKSDGQLGRIAEKLALHLMDALCQGSCSIQGPTTTVWLTRRQSD